MEKAVSHNKFTAFRYYTAPIRYKGELFEIILNVGIHSYEKKLHLYAITNRPLKQWKNTAHSLTECVRSQPNCTCRKISGALTLLIICKIQEKSIGVNEKVSAHLAVCPVRSLTCIQAGSETETSYTFIICKKRNLSSPPCGRILCWRQYGLADDFRAGVANFALRK